MMFHLLRPSAFSDAYGKPAVSDSPSIVRSIPTQVERNEINIEETKKVGESFADSVKTIMASNAIISILFAGVL